MTPDPTAVAPEELDRLREAIKRRDGTERAYAAYVAGGDPDLIREAFVSMKAARVEAGAALHSLAPRLLSALSSERAAREEAERERDAARETNRRLHNRCQLAEAALPEWENLRNGWKPTGGSFGRALLAWEFARASEAATEARRERDAALSKLSEAEARSKELEADARRWRWIRSQAELLLCGYRSESGDLDDATESWWALRTHTFTAPGGTRPESVDALVDADMASGAALGSSPS